MSMKKTLGGDRLGSGNKMQVELHGYERSTHDLGYIWRSTMASGTLVPFMCEVVLPGDTFDINLDVDIKTHPTIGPLFGSYKIQLDIFEAPLRLYNGLLHNNPINIGMNMQNVKFPIMTLQAGTLQNVDPQDIDNVQISSSSLLSYLGVRGVGRIVGAEADELATRDFNGVPLLMYWDTYKNYYANKQEEIGAVIRIEAGVGQGVITQITMGNDEDYLLDAYPEITNPPITINRALPGYIKITYVTGTEPLLKDIIVKEATGAKHPLDWYATVESTTSTVITARFKPIEPGLSLYNNFITWQYNGNDVSFTDEIQVSEFPLENIDIMRNKIMQVTAIGAPAFSINTANLTPYNWLIKWESILGNQYNPMNKTQQGLGIKTYQSDLFNNWLSTEWIDGPGGITEITSIDTTGGSFSIDTLNLARKVYNYLNRIAVSGGTYDDWQDATWAHRRYTRCETPVYHGGLIKELVFQEVVSNSESQGPDGSAQPLGTLAGKGVMAKKHKGGSVTIKVDEPGYIMGIISLTPRIDYSQGNKWDTMLKTMDDLHKPALDEIGFQELITEQMAWWSTTYDAETDTWEQRSAGKQPAWINYMTNVNQTRGNFAIADNEMFMTLNRRYEYSESELNLNIVDLTTYIDPAKYNFIFAQTAIDSQNFWAQIAVDITARRKMSAKVMPNL